MVLSQTMLTSTGSSPFFATQSTRLYGAPMSFEIVISSSLGALTIRRISSSRVLICPTASTTLSVPASPLVLIK